MSAPPIPPRGARGLLSAMVMPAPSPPRLAIAIQAGVAMLLTVGLPAAFGHLEIGLLASTGALSALYLSARSRRERLRRLPLVQVGLLLAVVLGALAGGSAIAASVVLVVVAIGAVVLVSMSAVGPPGALFPVLGAGVASRLTGPPSLGGDGIDPLTLIAWTAAGEAFALLVVIAPLAVPSVRRRDALLPTAPIRFALDDTGRTVVLRIAAAAVAAAAVAALLGLERGYWVVVAVVAVLQAGRGRRISGIRGVHRAVGTLVGAAVFVLLATLIGLPAAGLLLAVVLGLLQFGAEMLVVRHYGVALLLITPLALLIAEAGSAGDPWTIAGTRVLDTAIGCAIALLVLVADRLLAGVRRA
jgi:hypothetical protein